ncbi:MAG: calcium/sodium antiporter [Lachnospiraceae bacterium]|nr:calcium/sodium antiporter [Lachnospiraceae bacterium]
MEYVLLFLGFILLIKGADFFVDGAADVARKLKIPSIIIGLTVVAFGTSLPEASVSITAAINGSNELALSNVIGSNIFNLLIVVGVSAALRPILVRKSVLKFDFPYSILITVVLLLMCIPTMFQGSVQSVIQKWEGFVLLAFFVFYLIITVRSALKARKEHVDSPEDNISHPTWQIIVFIILGLAGIVIGGDLVVDSASAIAISWGWSETFVGLTIVALGTSLPELVTSVIAAGKGESDLALGNVVGSNIFNILLVLGASSALSAVPVNLFSIYDILFLIIASLVVYLFAWRKKNISRPEGLIMIPIYVAFFLFIAFR